MSAVRGRPGRGRADGRQRLNDELPTGITRTPLGYRVFVRVNGHLYPKRYPPTTPIKTMVLWREEMRVRVRVGLPTDQPTGETFRDDARSYLAAVRGMPTFRWRRDDIDLWIAVFGDRQRSSIQSHEIRAQLTKWRVTYAANTVNHRRSALMHLWTVLDGKSSPNPVKDVPRYRDESQDDPPRALSPQVIRCLFAKLYPGRQKALLQLMAWTGWPQAQIGRLEPGDVDWRARRVFIRRRQKGKGTAGSWRLLLPRGWAALRIFRRYRAWGPVHTSNARRALRQAALHVQADTTLPAHVKAAVEDITPYDLRHSFLTLVALTSGDDRALAEIAGHADRRMIGRYTKAANDPRVTDALSAVTTALKVARKAV